LAPPTYHRDEPSLRDYLQIVSRRPGTIALVLALVCFGAFVRSWTQEPSYRASADVLLVQNDRAGLLSGGDAGGLQEDPERFAVTQARLARIVDIMRATVNATDPSMSPAQLRQSSTVTAAPDADFLRFSVTDSRADRAISLATEYARQFSLYRARLDNAAISRALRQVTRQLQGLRSSGQTGSPIYAQLLNTQHQLATAQLLDSPRAVVADKPSTATKVAPRPARDVLIAGGLGFVLALALVFLLEALDTRLRAADELAARIGVPLLGRTLAAPRKSGPGTRLPTVYDPSGIHAEAYRMVRLNVEFANLGPKAKLMMVTSALSGEGKTLAAANLAVSFARAGRKVLLVDLDLRRPGLHELFGVESAPGVTDVTLRDAELDDALVRGVLRGSSEMTPIARGGERASRGSLTLLPAGVSVPDPGAFLETSALPLLLDELRSRFDIALIDTSPLLRVGDGLALGGIVDAVLVVSGSRQLRKSEARELSQALDTVQAPKLGLVVTGVDEHPAYSPYREREDSVLAKLPVAP
jgi:tyrosine-protein kinase